MTYSEISEIRVKNFRCLEELVLSFEKSPIIALVAGNDGGKSSVVKAIQSTIYNDERDIKNYIRTGTRGFQIDITFRDGIKIERVKTAASSTYTLYNPDGSVKQTWDKMNQDMPEVVRNIFGVKIEDVTGELLNLRTCENLLLFSLTKTTDNYKIVHSCISSELIEKTYEVGNGRIKELEKTISKSETLRDEMYSQANRILTYSDEALTKISQGEQHIQSMISVENTMFNCFVEKLNCDEKRNEISSIDQTKLNTLIEAKFSDNELKSLDILNSLMTDLQNIVIRKESLRSTEIENLTIERISDQQLEVLNKSLELNELRKVIMSKTGGLSVEDAIMSRSQKLASLNEKADEVKTIQTEITNLSNVLKGLEELIGMSHKLIETESRQARSKADLEDTYSALKSTGTVRYDKETNSLVKSCVRCSNDTYFYLNELNIATEV